MLNFAGKDGSFQLQDLFCWLGFHLGMWSTTKDVSGGTDDYGDPNPDKIMQFFVCGHCGISKARKII